MKEGRGDCFPITLGPYITGYVGFIMATSKADATIMKVR